MRLFSFFFLFLDYFLNIYFFKFIYFEGVWVAQSVKHPTSAQVMISQSVSSSPTLGSVLLLRGGAEREGDTESETGSQALSCQHRAWCGAQTCEPGDHVLSWNHTFNWTTQVPLNFTYSRLFILVLLLLLFLSNTKKSLPKPMSRSLLPLFLLGVFVVSGLMFNSFIHFQLICVCGISRQVSYFSM